MAARHARGGKARGAIAVYAVERTSLQTWMAHLLDNGIASGTVRTRHLAVRRFAAWLIATGRLRQDPFPGVKGPVQRQTVVTRR